ncbi:hypothetical protein BH09MYX1_BH09MYX1_58090 [soil metagenome]
MTTQDVSARDRAALQGVWRQLRCEADGVVDPHDDLSAGVFTTIDAAQFSVHTPEGELVLRGSFVLDATTTPKSITWIDSVGPDGGKHLPAIYTLQGDAFTFIAADEGCPRPSEFRTTKGLTMRSLLRVTKP